MIWKLYKASPSGDFESVVRKRPGLSRKYGFLYYGYKPRYWWFFVWEFVADWLVGFQAMFVDASLAFHFIFVSIALGEWRL